MAARKPARAGSVSRGSGASQTRLLSDQVQQILRFPDQNPNPVMRISDDGHLLYANAASRPIVAAFGLEVGEQLPDRLADDLRRSASCRPPQPIEVINGHTTFEVLPVAVPEMGFTNLYGTDVTARKAIDKFPDQNPNPVLRIDDAGTLIYANRASRPIVEAEGLVVGRPVPARLNRRVTASLAEAGGQPIELTCGPRTYELLPVRVPEFDFINLYGTDVTAVRQIAEANRENERLLLNILPPPIADRLRSGERIIADRFDAATLLIADIVGFTRLASDLPASEVVDLLNAVFSAVDELVDRHGLEKVKTIGDAYMVVGGIPSHVDDHLERMADLALELTSSVAGVQSGSAHSVSVRVGMHTGPAVAGVIGVKKFIYDVWGDTVNLASRMESLGVPGRVQVTHAVYSQLADRYRFEPRGMIEVKGIGPLPTWFLVGHKATRRPSPRRPAAADATLQGR